MSNLIFCLMGPSASGKTTMALELIKAFPFEIISVDSALIYREMDIGTAKPDKEILEAIPHHLIDILNPPDSYSVADFIQDVDKLCKEIQSKNKIPLLVGGTMMYFRALQEGLSKLPKANLKIRRDITETAKDKGWNYLHNKLRDVDKISAEKIHPNDSQRIGRALEVYLSSGRPLSDFFQDSSVVAESFINLMLIPEDRSLLHEQIALRFKSMITAGLIDEVVSLLDKWNLDLTFSSMRSVGYRQVFSYLQNEYNYQTLIEKGIVATRQLAKRQLTWLRSWHTGDNYKFQMENPNIKVDIMAKIKEILDNRDI